MQLKHWFLIVSVVVVLYVVSFGPSVFLIAKLSKTSVVPSSVIRPFLATWKVVYYPHLYAMALAEPYFTYAVWWATLAGRPVLVNYDDYRSEILGERAPATGAPATGAPATGAPATGHP